MNSIINTNNKNIILNEKDFDIDYSKGEIYETGVMHVLHHCATKTMEFINELRHKHQLKNITYFQLSIESFNNNFFHINKAIGTKYSNDNGIENRVILPLNYEQLVIKNSPIEKELLNHFIYYEENYKKLRGMETTFSGPVNNDEVSLAIEDIYICFSLLQAAFGLIQFEKEPFIGKVDVNKRFCNETRIK